jgi:protocatechuate 3,4-dioxygenase beta subunit
MRDGPLHTSRRRALRLLFAAPFAAGVLGPLLRAEEAAAAEALLADTASGRHRAPTPECGDDDEPTPRETAGPFFKPRSPERASLLEPDLAGTRLELSGTVFGRGCVPLAGALLDFWQADSAGDYDLDGYRCRGHQLTDANGRWRLSTVLPGLYPGRTRHIHVRVQPRSPDGSARVLTTQLYFPGEPRNRRDGLFMPQLLVALDAGGTPRRGRFHFLLNANG